MMDFYIQIVHLVRSREHRFLCSELCNKDDLFSQQRVSFQETFMLCFELYIQKALFFVGENTVKCD
jgi:hypothetical protein